MESIQFGRSGVIRMEKVKILIVEDEEKIARVIKLELEYEGYQTTVVNDGLEAWQLLIATPDAWDLVLLDIMLPGLSGIEILRRLRKEEISVPVIMLTARDAIVDKVTGLDQGADDYVTKPFEIEELLARMRVLIRRNNKVASTQADQSIEENLLQYSDLKVNLGTREITRSNKHIELTPREFDLLVYLMKNNHQVLSRDQILEQVWGFDYFGDTNVVDVYIRYLRNKMDRGFRTEIIQTVRGVGYVMKEKES